MNLENPQNEEYSNSSGNVRSLLQRFWSLPSIKHGTLIGALFALSKVVFYATGNWTYVLDIPYMLLTPVLLLYAMWMANKAEREQLQEQFVYLRAVFSGMRVIIMAITCSVLTDAVLYNADKGLTDIAIDFQVAKFVEATQQVAIFKPAEKDLYVKTLKELKPATFVSLWSTWFSKILFNAFWAVFLGIFTRYRIKHSWLHEN
jgi:hypothetical protein